MTAVSRASGDATVADLARRFGLSRAEVDIVIALLAVELGDAPDSESLTTVARLGTALGRAHDTAILLAPGGHLASHALIELSGDGVFASRRVRLPDAVWARLVGAPVALPFAIAPCDPDNLARQSIAPTTRAQAERILSFAARSRSLPIIPVVGPSHRATGALASALASQMGYAVVVVPATELDRGDRLPEIRREARWLGAAIVVEGAPSTAALNRLALEMPAPIFVITDEPLPAESGAVPGRWRLDLDVDELSADERRAVWEASLAGASLAPEVDLDVVAAHLRFGPARIVAAASAARHAADAEGLPVSTATILRAARQRSDPGRLARRLHRDHRLTDVVVPDATRRELELACTWVRHAGAAFRGPSAGRPLRGRSGLVCLFHGPPGTGKTLAAQAIAGEVGLELLSIDLSAVVDKYIGETEKNLSRAFDEAENTGAILFFDEADALFGKRSQVKDAHDRFANIETAFLLERVERHRGVCILASNLRQNLDDAFTRRIRVIAEFPPPGPAERLAIWNLHVVRTELAGDVDLPALAQRFAICGGDINNAAATAVLLAAADGCAVAMRHLAVGVWRELRKAGRLVSPDDFGPWRDAIATYARASR